MRKSGRNVRIRHSQVVSNFATTYNSVCRTDGPAPRRTFPGRRGKRPRQVASERHESETVYESASTHESHASAVGQGELGMPKILCLGGTHDEQVALRERLGGEFEVVEVSSPARALAELANGDYIGIYADADHFSEVIDVGRFLQNERILEGMPDGVVLLASDNTILWGNGRLREWTGREDVDRRELLRGAGQPRDPRARLLPVPHRAWPPARPAPRRSAATTATSTSTPPRSSRTASRRST